MLFLSLLFFFQIGGGIIYQEEPSSQKNTERVFSSEETKQKIKQISFESTINRAGIIKAYDEFVFILDYSPYPVIKKFNLETGKVVQKFGNGRGRGPGELINPTDFSITSDGKVWIADQPQSKLSVFDAKGEHIEDWVIEFTPYKTTSLGQNLAIFMVFLILLSNWLIILKRLNGHQNTLLKTHGLGLI